MDIEDLIKIKRKGMSIEVPKTKCDKCQEKLDIRMTTELLPEEEKLNMKPEIIILLGICSKCSIIYALRAIKIKDIPKF